MEDIQIPFNLYDFWANIFPGIFLIGFIVWEFSPNSLNLINSISLGFLLIVAYVVGHLLQGVSSYGEKFYYKRWGKYPSIHFLKEDNDWFSKEFKANLKKAIYKKFNVSNELSLQEMFELCYKYVIQKDIGGRAEKFLSILGFHRNMLVVALIALFPSFVKLAMFVNPTNLMVTVFLLIFILVSFYQYSRFSKNFAKEVYTQFYVHISTEK